MDPVWRFYSKSRKKQLKMEVNILNSVQQTSPIGNIWKSPLRCIILGWHIVPIVLKYEFMHYEVWNHAAHITQALAPLCSLCNLTLDGAFCVAFIPCTVILSQLAPHSHSWRSNLLSGMKRQCQSRDITLTSAVQPSTLHNFCWRTGQRKVSAPRHRTPRRCQQFHSP